MIDEGLEADRFPTVTDLGDVVDGTTATSDGWRYQIGFPDQAPT